MDWNDYINWTGGTNHYKVVIDESNCGLIIDDIRLESDITESIFQNVMNSCIYNIYILAHNSDSTYVAKSNQISVVNLPKKPDFNYITSVSVDHNDGGN